jgi:hypothetical protein
MTTAFAHAHPIGEGRRFEHTHSLPAEQLEQGTAPSADLAGRSHVAAVLEREHAAKPLAEAHPDMADVARAPAPGSPADLRRQAGELAVEADRLRHEAARVEQRARALLLRADHDERHPPTESERLRGLLERRG